MDFDNIPEDRPFFIVRHGETAANTSGLACGLLDVPLTDKGKLQAITAGQALAAIVGKKSRIIYSPLQRARETAQLVAKQTGGQLLEYRDLHEHSFGDWEGLPWSDVFRNLQSGRHPPNGESREHFIARIVSALCNILYAEEDPPIIVAHGGTFYALLAHYGLYPADIGNCEIIYFEPRSSTKFPWATFYVDPEFSHFQSFNLIRPMPKEAA